MIYMFKCECGNTQTVMCSMNEISEQKSVCKKCGFLMYRIFSRPCIKISKVPYDYGKGMNPDKEQQQILERTGGWGD